MDLIDSRTRNITHMALNGLYERSRAIASNTANVLTPGYQRKEVLFEGQLRSVIEDENLKREIKLENTAHFQRKPLDILKQADPAQIAFLNKNPAEDFRPEIMTDSSDSASDGNNVILEYEMMDAAKTGTQYAILSNLMAKSFQGMERVIKGQ